MTSMFVVICTVFMAIAVCNTVNVKMEPEVVMGRDYIETKLITLKYVHDENKAWCCFKKYFSVRTKYFKII